MAQFCVFSVAKQVVIYRCDCINLLDVNFKKGISNIVYRVILLLLLITSTLEVLFSLPFVCVFVCLCVCVSARLRKNYCTNLHQIFFVYTYWEKKDRVRFWARSDKSPFTPTAKVDLRVKFVDGP